MSAPAQYAIVDAGPLSLDGLKQLVDNLSADARAQLRWSPQELRTALHAFLDGARDQQALRELVRLLIDQFTRIGIAFGSLARQPELLRPELEAVWRADAALLRGHLQPAANDAAEWVMRVWKAYIDWSLTAIRSSSVDPTRLLAEASSDPALAESVHEPGSPFRTQCLMMASIEAVRSGLPEGVAAELVFRAVDEVVVLRQLLERVGFHVDPFRDETLAERGERLTRYAEHLRNSMSPSDDATLDAARLRTLR